MSTNVPISFSATDLTAQAFSSVRGRLNALGESVISVRGLIGTLTAGFGVGAFAAGIKSASEAADAAAKMGDRFGIATEKIIGMQHAGNLAGTSNSALTAGLKNMATQAIEAARGGEEARRAFTALGINAREFINLPMDEQMAVVIEKLGGVENATLRNELANKVLGKSYGEIMGLVAEGADAFRQASEDARAWGLAVSRVDAAKLELANDAITRAKAAAQGLFTTIAIHVAPVIKLIADRFADGAKEANGFRDQVASGMERVAQSVGAVIWFVERLHFAYAAVKVGVAAMGVVAIEVFKFIAEQVERVTRIASYLPGPFGMAAKAMNALAKDGVSGLSEMAEVAQNRFAELQGELDQIAGGTSTLEEWKERVLSAFRQAAADVQVQAEAIAKARQTMMGGGDTEVEEDKGSGAGGKNDNAWRDKLAAQLERIREQNMGELELLQEKHREQNEVLQSAVESGLITEEEGLARSAVMRANFEAARTKLIDDAEKKRLGIANIYRKMDVDSAGYFFNMMSNMMQSKNRAMFEVGKAAAISGAILDTYKAATGAYAALAMIPYVGPFLGAAAAAAAIVAGMARVQQIKSTSFGSGATGGAAPVYSANPTTGVPTEPINPEQRDDRTVPGRAVAAEAARNVHITFIGGEDKRYTYKEVAEEIIPLINEAGGNGVNVTVSAG